MSTCTQCKKGLKIFYILSFHTVFKIWFHFTLTTHLILNQPHFQCSTATGGQWPPYRIVQVYRIYDDNSPFITSISHLCLLFPSGQSGYRFNNLIDLFKTSFWFQVFWVSVSLNWFLFPSFCQFGVKFPLLFLIC